MPADSADHTKPDDIGAVKVRLADLGKLVQASSHLPGGVRSALIRSLDELSATLAMAEKASLTDKERIVHAAETATRLIAKPQPEWPLLERSIKSLSEAAHALRDREPRVVEVVSGIAVALADIGI
jgi:hypothetical protein